MSDTYIYFVQGKPFSAEELSVLARCYLHENEQARAAELTLASRQHEFVIGRALARFGAVIAGRQGFDTPIEKKSKGKPVFKAANEGERSAVAFSITHTDEIVACALGHVETLGLDVELMRRAPNIDGVKARVFSDFELAELSSLTGAERDQRLLQIWTSKEAWTKAIGEGLGFDFSSFSLEFEGDKISLAPNARYEATDWQIECLLRGKYCFSLAQHSSANGALEKQFQPVTFDDLLQMARLHQRL